MRTALLPLFALFFLCACNEQEKKPAAAAPEKIFTTADACLFSEIAYCNEPQAQIAKHAPAFTVQWNAVALNGNHAYAATDGKHIVVAIRGSLMEFSWDAFENWIYQDLNIGTQEKWPYTTGSTSAKVSTGSYRGFKNLVQLKDKSSNRTLLTFLLETIKPGNILIVTGHSLGGNLATVLASYLSNALKEKKHNASINVITFAAPAAGNAAFAKDFNSKFPLSVRVENEGDIVPKFPCAAAIAGLAKLYAANPSAAAIKVGYNNVTVPLSSVFSGISTIVGGLQMASGFSSFTQTNGEGTILPLKLSGKNNSNDITSWFAEAGYQHGIAQYAKAMNIPIIDECK